MGLFQIIYIVLNSLVNEFADHLSSFVVKFSISLEKNTANFRYKFADITYEHSNIKTKCFY